MFPCLRQHLTLGQASTPLYKSVHVLLGADASFSSIPIDNRPLVLLDHADKAGRPAQGIDRPHIYSGIAEAYPPALRSREPPRF